MNRLNWPKIAAKHGYDGADKMIIDMYYYHLMSVDEICDKLIVSRKAVYDFMDKRGLPRRSPELKTICRWKGGPQCPYCGAEASKVCWGQTNGDGAYHRYRKCRKCGKHFETREIADEMEEWKE